MTEAQVDETYLIQTQQRCWEISRSLLATGDWHMRAVSTSNTNLTKRDRFVSPSCMGGNIVLSGLKCFDLIAEKYLVATQFQRIFRASQKSWKTHRNALLDL